MQDDPEVPLDLLTISQTCEQMPWFSERFLRDLRDNRTIRSWKLGPHKQSKVVFSRADLMDIPIYAPSMDELTRGV